MGEESWRVGSLIFRDQKTSCQTYAHRKEMRPSAKQSNDEKHRTNTVASY